MNAPPDLLVWYLAVFRRMFMAMETAGANQDRELMWLTQWAADSLHNVPEVLLHYRERGSWFSRDPEAMRSSVLALPIVATQHGAPARVAELAGRLVTTEGSAAELGLAATLVDLDLAPDAELATHLEQLYSVCLWTRHRNLWPGPEPGAWDACEEQGWYNGICGGRAKELPLGLVHWTAFDPTGFRAQLEQPYPKPDGLPSGGPSRDSPSR